MFVRCENCRGSDLWAQRADSAFKVFLALVQRDGHLYSLGGLVAGNGSANVASVTDAKEVENKYEHFWEYGP
jgi:hypothetical protein